MCPDESSYVVRATESEAWVFGERATLRLTTVLGTTPSRYVQGEVELVIEGEHGILSEPGKKRSRAGTIANELYGSRPNSMA